MPHSLPQFHCHPILLSWNPGCFDDVRDNLLEGVERAVATVKVEKQLDQRLRIGAQVLKNLQGHQLVLMGAIRRGDNLEEDGVNENANLRPKVLLKIGDKVDKDLTGQAKDGLDGRDGVLKQRHDELLLHQLDEAWRVAEDLARSLQHTE